MSEALCGPSNALQQFKQHTNFDRSLQQDRVTSRHSPAQGFRSHNPNATLLDPEFEAFQSGVPLPDLPQYQHQPSHFHAPSPAQGWANDFQNMQISPPPSFRPHHQAPLASSSSSSWAQGFQQHVAQTAPRTQTASPSPQAFQYQARYGGLTGFQSNFAPSTFAPVAHVNSGKGKEAIVDQFDDAAFERAFDEARESMMVESDVSTHTVMDEAIALSDAIQSENSAVKNELRASDHMEEGVFEPIHMQTGPQIITDRLSDPTQEEQTTQQQEDDALAATAQELLEKVEHNQTDKFRNSQFLHLMRKLRDREVKVEGDKMVETVSSTPKRPPLVSTTDSAYASADALPHLAKVYSRARAPEFDSHYEEGYRDEAAFDHWESSLR